MKTILIGLTLLAGVLSGEQSYVLQQQGVRIHVIEFSEAENVGFEFVSAEKETQSFSISDHYSAEAYTFAVNGAYFDGNLNPIGYCRINNQDLSNTVEAKLSGYLTTTQNGELGLHWKQVPEGDYRDVVQAGPFIIDPNGIVGIRARSGKAAKRTVLAMTTDHKVLILTTSEVYLYDLARILKSEMPMLERALNLDGGPSVGLIYDDVRIQNQNPVSNFLRRRNPE